MEKGEGAVKGVSPVEAVNGDGDGKGDHDDNIGAKEEEDKEEGPALAVRFPVGPQSVLKLCCGDVPLSQYLRNEIIRMEDDTGMSVRNMVDCIVCTDYIGIVIDALRLKHRKERWKGGRKGGSQGGGQR